ncbi:unnamed protein product [Rhizophagus irregularis]|nr:unnamed protein product [Rhizophagus irregularis]
MSDDPEKDNDCENERDLTIGNCILEPIVQIINDDEDYMQEMQEEKTDEEISLHSLEKKLKNIPPTRAPSTHLKVQPGGAGSIEIAFSKAQTTNAKLQGEEYLDILNNLVDWVIADCQPFRVVDNLHFKKFITSLNSRFQIPLRQTLRKKIDEKYRQYKKVIKIFQENDSKISFTSDMWTSDTGASYMVLTAHWIDDKWDLKYTVIAFQKFPYPHTASTITIDNGANQVLGINLLSTKLSNELQVNFNIIRCGAHTIALVVNAGLKKLQPVIDKVRAFVVEIRRSPKKEQELLDLAEKLQVNYKKLIRDVRTRWNSIWASLVHLNLIDIIALSVPLHNTNVYRLLTDFSFLVMSTQDSTKLYCSICKRRAKGFKNCSGLQRHETLKHVSYNTLPSHVRFKGEKAFEEVGKILDDENWGERNYGGGQLSFVCLHMPEVENSNYEQSAKKSKTKSLVNREMTVQWKINVKFKENLIM